MTTLLVAGCASHYEPAHFAHPYGFFSGMWHGTIFWLSLLGELLSWIVSHFGGSFLDSVTIIGRPNTGLGYYVGFAVGLLGILGGGLR